MPEKKPSFLSPHTALAFDYGTQSIGVAVGQSITGTATPLKCLPARDGIPNWDNIKELLTEWKPDTLIVGLPLNMDGSDSELCQRARKFSRRLKGRFGIACKLCDERLSTREAKELTGQYGNFRNKPVDSIAAVLILETWFKE